MSAAFLSSMFDTDSFAKNMFAAPVEQKVFHCQTVGMLAFTMICSAAVACVRRTSSAILALVLQPASDTWGSLLAEWSIMALNEKIQKKNL
jgi:hypothetical protein